MRYSTQVSTEYWHFFKVLKYKRSMCLHVKGYSAVQILTVPATEVKRKTRAISY